MKKILPILLTVLAVFCLVSCKGEPEPELEPETPVLVLRKIIEKQYDGSTGILSMTITREYDPEGKIVCETEQGEEAYMYYNMEYFYDDNGNTVMMKATDLSGTIVRWVEFEFDSHNNKTKEISKDASGTVIQSKEWIHEYDTSGNAVKISYKLNGDIKNWEEHAYTGGKLTRITYKDNDGSVEGHVTGYLDYEYTVNGYTEIQKDESGAEYYYTYYENDRVVREENPLGAGTEYSYDPDGNLILEYSYDSFGVGSYKTDYRYDDAGHQTDIFNSLNDSVRGWIIGEWTRFEYDKDGNLVKQTVSDSSLSVLGWMTYENIFG